MTKKTILITGASRGIGAKTALYFAKNGYNVAINFNNSAKNALKLKEQIKKLGGVANIYKADVSNSDEVLAMVQSVVDDFGSIDVLVNNAGIAHHGLITDVEDDEWEELVGTNISGMFYCSREVLKHMIKEQSGIIVNVSSIWGQVGASCEVAYSTTKGAVISFTKALSKEVGPSGIRVNCVSPGVIMTDMCRDLDEDTLEELKESTSLEELGTTLDVAKAIFFLASDKSKYITGQVLTVDGGMV